MIIIATFVGSSHFKVPEGVPLLSKEENDKVDGPVAWSWYVRWNRLHYLDADLKEHKVPPYLNAEHDGIDWKHPEDVQLAPEDAPEWVEDEEEVASDDDDE